MKARLYRTYVRLFRTISVFAPFERRFDNSFYECTQARTNTRPIFLHTHGGECVRFGIHMLFTETQPVDYLQKYTSSWVIHSFQLKLN